MPTLSAWAIRTALVWLALAALIGALILARDEIGLPRLILLRPAHAEMMLVGWMMQLAFGVAHWILPRRRVAPAAPAGEGRGALGPVLFVVVALNLGVLLVILGATLAGRVLEAAAVVGFALQGVPRIRAAGWGATGTAGDLVRLKRRPEMPG